LRRETESRSYYDEKSGKNLKVTISVGIAQFPLHDTVKSQLIEKADAALYTAKETGRNRVCIAKVSKEALQKLKDKE
jgi:diguanylate cyclase (GGDEF)-like protein